MTLPSVGVIVMYTLDVTARNRIEQRRGRGNYQGSPVQPGDVLPMVVTRVFPQYGNINGQLILDGDGSLWVTNAAEGLEQGRWSWCALPPRADNGGK